jgi:hypothetical protein
MASIITPDPTIPGRYVSNFGSKVRSVQIPEDTRPDDLPMRASGYRPGYAGLLLNGMKRLHSLDGVIERGHGLSRQVACDPRIAHDVKEVCRIFRGYSAQNEALRFQYRKGGKNMRQIEHRTLWTIPGKRREWIVSDFKGVCHAVVSGSAAAVGNRAFMFLG